jgi:hypothetical protein
MTIVLDPQLLAQTRRRGQWAPPLTEQERIAINLFWRKGVTVKVIARAFGDRQKNTLYYKCLTGDAKSYPQVRRGTNSAIEINRKIDEIGEEEAWKQYVTDDMVRAVNKAMKAEAAKA